MRDSTFLSAFYEYAIKMWKVNETKSLRTFGVSYLEGYKSGVKSVCKMSESTFLSASYYIKMWDANSGRKIEDTSTCRVCDIEMGNCV